MSNILGVIWILLGLLWTVKPEILKNRLKRKISRKIKFVVYSSIIVLGFLMIGSIIKAPGLLPKIIGILGLFLVIKGILLIMSKATDKLWKWWAERPLLFFRIQGLFCLAIGIMLVRA